MGVVGGIGSGKSAVSAVLAEFGAFVIDADKVGHALLNQPPVLDRLLERFGRVILAPVEETEGRETVDRKALGAIVFSDPKALRDLESILHPRMRQTFEKAIARTIRRGEAKAVVLDAAILYEAGWDSLCDRVLFVDTPKSVRVERLRESRGWSEEAVTRRESSQWPLDRKRQQAEWVVSNEGDLDALKSAVAQAWSKVLASAPPRLRGPSRPRIADDSQVGEPRREPGGGHPPRGKIWRPRRPPR
ncbi:MAG: dephospho-CoA kinase [Isosphaeraceae bacterium]